MPRTEDAVWNNFQKVTNLNGQIVKRMCIYCKAEFVPNATRAKKHLVADCLNAPVSIKQHFLSDVNKQCFVGKRKLSLELNDEHSLNCKQTTIVHNCVAPAALQICRMLT